MLGFSTGVFYKEGIPLTKRIAIIREAGCRALELGLISMEGFFSEEVSVLESGDFTGFDYVSLHAPNFRYGRNPRSRQIIERIRLLNMRVNLDLVVFHPDQITDFSIFNGVGFRAAFENMDNRKASHQTPEEMAAMLATNPEYGFVLDLNHVYSNDATMNMAADFYALLGHRISEIHLSGYAGYHEPLHVTKQASIISAVRKHDVPIIVESVLTVPEFEKEVTYLTSHLG
ncbi:hypothetical protein ACFL2D_02850 [Patescibacteria group bacterium]